MARPDRQTKQRGYKKGSKAIIMEKIAVKTGAITRVGPSGTKNMTEEDFKKILYYIEDLEIQVDELKREQGR